MRVLLVGNLGRFDPRASIVMNGLCVHLIDFLCFDEGDGRRLLNAIMSFNISIVRDSVEGTTQ